MYTFIFAFQCPVAFQNLFCLKILDYLPGDCQKESVPHFVLKSNIFFCNSLLLIFHEKRNYTKNESATGITDKKLQTGLDEIRKLS